jgi:ABC-type uncharacterized transport system substrate-binding protein
LRRDRDPYAKKPRLSGESVLVGSSRSARLDFSLGGKWLEVLKEIAPGVKRAAVLRDSALAAGSGQLGAIQAVALSVGVEVSPVDVRDAGEIERAVVAFARSPNGGLIVPASGLVIVHRDLIIMLAARHKLPAVYYYSFFVAAGGLVSSGPDPHDQYRRAAGYVDRVLKGEKPADLPVQVSCVTWDVLLVLLNPPQDLTSCRAGARPGQRYAQLCCGWQKPGTV